MTHPKPPLLTRLDISKPHSARMYDYYLGGKDWYPVDRDAAEKVKDAFMGVGVAARANRGFMRRSTALLASEYGIRQFIDIGTGIPTAPNLHQIAQAAAPEARIVYADHDRTVLDYAEALMRSTPKGRTAYLHADVRHSDLLDRPALHKIINLNEPVALSLVALMHFVQDDEKPYEIVQHLLSQLCSGSVLVLSHATGDFDEHGAWPRITEIYSSSATPIHPRPKEDIERFFIGLEMLAPGVVPTQRWLPEREAEHTDSETSAHAGVAMIP